MNNYYLFFLLALLSSCICDEYPDCPKNARFSPFGQWCVCNDGYWGDVVYGFGECHECDSNTTSLYTLSQISEFEFVDISGCDHCKPGYYMKKAAVKTIGSERAAECVKCPEKQTTFRMQREVGIDNCVCKDYNAVKINNVCQCKEGYYGTPSDEKYESTCIKQTDSSIPPNLRN